MAGADLRQLMLEAEQQSTEITSMGTALPILDRNLRQVCEASRDLWSRLQQTVPMQDTDAHLLLGSKGVDLSQLSQKLETLSSRDMLAPLEPTPDTDIESFLMNETQNALLNIIEESRKDSFNQVEVHESAVLDDLWITEKANLLNMLTEESSDDTMMLTESQLETSVRSDAPSAVRSLMSSVEMAYADRVMEYNKGSLTGTKKDSLVQIFKDVSLQFNDKKVPELWDCLEAMMHMPVELTVNSGDPIKCRNSAAIQIALIKQARNFLQQRYKIYMQTVVSQNLLRARTGGVPSTYPLVKGFVGLQETSSMHSEDGMVDGRPIWSLIYYCLRCGDAKAALYSAQQGTQLSNFCPILEELIANAGGQLSNKTVDTIRNNYRRGIVNCSDPYKKAVYCLLGACDVREDYPEVVPTAEDYLWFKLGQIRIQRDQQGESVMTAASDVLTYNHLQCLIVQEYGESYYNAKEQPYLYANMLLLTGQFEAAVDFLARTGTGLLRPHAVHMALALHESGLLATPATVQSPLLSFEECDPSPSRRLNLARLILMYCQKFLQTNLREVLHYYYFLRDLKGSDGVSLFKLCVSELAQETGAYGDILGSVAADGTRLSGLIDNFYSSTEEVKQVIRMVAEDSEKKALLEHSVPLYELCGDHEGALRILGSLLGQVLPLESVAGSQSQRDRLARCARDIQYRYRGCHLNCPSATSNNFTLLCQLLDFFDLYHAQDFNAAKEVLTKTNLLPKKESEVDEYTKSFRHLDDSIMRNFPDILLAAMNILCFEYSKQKLEAKNSALKEQALDSLRKEGQAVTAFSATLPYNMPGDTNSRLVQFMMKMN